MCGRFEVLPLVDADEPAGDADGNACQKLGRVPGGPGGGGQEAVSVGDQMVGVAGGMSWLGGLSGPGGPGGLVWIGGLGGG